MNELLETERAYVEELLCVLEVRVGGRTIPNPFHYCHDNLSYWGQTLAAFL